MTEPDERSDDIEDAAAAWVIRLGGPPLAPAERRALDDWLAARADHRAAFDRARAAWAELAGLAAAPGSLAADVVPAAAPRGPRRPRRRPWAPAGALAATLVLAIGLGAVWFGDPVTALVADHRTAPAEIRTVRLPDGSQVALGPASAVDLRFDDRERRVALLAGVVHVTVRPIDGGESRPFLVEAAGGTVRALGTRFVVDRAADDVAVTVTEHQVEVAVATPAGPADTAIVSSGQSVRYGRRGGLGAVEAGSPDHATAWVRGRLVFDRAPLAEVVAVLNRYRHGRIVVADAALADRRVSGVFDAERLDEALASIARELGADIAAVPPFVTLLY